jgi:predicted AlkP superfamily pyrophosphatase or phosphodiesterase
VDQVADDRDRGEAGAAGAAPEPAPLLPDYSGACIANVVPTLLDPPEVWPEWFPSLAADAEHVLLIVLDGLGWEQLQEHPDRAPTLTSMEGGPILTVVPSTTATAMTSITTGQTPGQHGVVGYRVAIDHAVLNVLRWSIDGRDARVVIPPEKLQPTAAFLGQHPPAITRADFRQSGFTNAHLDGVRFHGYRVTSSLVMEARRLLQRGEPFVYAYYEGVDKVAHEYGLGPHFEAEVRYADRLVADVASAVPKGTVVVVTADHGQIDVGDRIVALTRDVLDHVSFQSGEGRFRWLHARPGRTAALFDAAKAAHGDHAWVVTREQVIDDGWLGPTVTEAARGRLGDVALVAIDAVAFEDPRDTGPFELISRHGSLTGAEMRVPLLALRT